MLLHIGTRVKVTSGALGLVFYVTSDINGGD